MLINWQNSKREILFRAEATRAHKFTRVGGDVKTYLDTVVRNAIIHLVRTHPGVGKTITTGEKHDRSNQDTSE